MNIPTISTFLVALGALPFSAGVLLATWRQRRAVARRSRDLTIEVGPKVLLGFALTGVAAAPALATPSAATQHGAPMWLPDLDRGPVPTDPGAAATPSAHSTATPAARPTRTTRPTAQVPPPAPTGGGHSTYTVRHGDSLWSITAAHLGATVKVADVAAAWPHLYELNRAVIGTNPRLLIPGQQLALPATFVGRSTS